MYIFGLVIPCYSEVYPRLKADEVNHFSITFMCEPTYNKINETIL